jgi:membrane-bound ClpP family serine protease
LNLLQRIAGAIVGVVLFVLALVFASVILAVAGAIALVVGAWLWWRTRNLPRGSVRGSAGIGTRRGTGTSSGTVIEGEYRVEREVRRIDDDTR